jgi:hypothetical protein
MCWDLLKKAMLLADATLLSFAVARVAGQLQVSPL